MLEASKVFEKVEVNSAIVELTMVVPAPGEGACPLLEANVGKVGETALNSTYPLEVAPMAGNCAASQERSSCVVEKALTTRFPA